MDEITHYIDNERNENLIKSYIFEDAETIKILSLRL